MPAVADKSCEKIPKMRQLFPFAETAAETQVSFSAAFTDESNSGDS